MVDCTFFGRLNVFPAADCLPCRYLGQDTTVKDSERKIEWPVLAERHRIINSRLFDLIQYTASCIVRGRCQGLTGPS